MRAKRYFDDPEHDIMGNYPHEISYAASNSIDVDGIYLQVHRAGVTLKVPEDFNIIRDDSCMFHLIHCVFRGKGSVTVRGHTYNVKRGQCFVLASNERHIYTTDADDPLGLVWVEFAGGNSAQIVKHILDLGGPVYGDSIFTSLTNLCTSILYQPSLQNNSPRISNILYEMLMKLCEHVESENAQPPMVQSILKYIDENICSRLTLTEVAAQFGYHPAYFSNRFSKEMGITFSKYVMRRKIVYACHLLETTTWSVDRIAREMGFCDISHFISRFKALQGMTPMVYRVSRKAASAPKE